MAKLAPIARRCGGSTPTRPTSTRCSPTAPSGRSAIAAPDHGRGEGHRRPAADALMQPSARARRCRLPRRAADGSMIRHDAAETRPRRGAQAKIPRRHRRHAGMHASRCPTRRGARRIRAARSCCSSSSSRRRRRALLGVEDIMRAEAREQAQATLAKFAAQGARPRQPRSGNGDPRGQARRGGPQPDRDGRGHRHPGARRGRKHRRGRGRW